MATSSGFSALLRRLGVIIMIIIPVAIFLFLYYYKYIPSNRDKIQQYGFLLLNQHQGGINQSITDLGNYFSTEFEKLKGNPDTTQLLFKSPFQYTSVKLPQPKNQNGIERITKKILREQREVEYTITDNTSSFRFNVSIDEIVSRILESGQSDFFQYHYIISTQSENDSAGPKLFYSSKGLTLSGNLFADSFYNSKNLYFGNISHHEIQNTEYRSFSIPIQFDKGNFILTGLISEKEFLNRVNAIPFDLVNKVLIIIILILISLPFIKIYLISPIEKFGIKDISFLGLSIFCGSAVVMVILFQILMQLGIRIRTENELKSLGDEIHGRFNTELVGFCHAGKKFDQKFISSIISNNYNDSIRNDINANVISMDLIGQEKRWSLGLDKEAKGYPSYTVLQWTGSNGKQSFKGRLDGEALSLIDVNNRKYFTDLFENKIHIADSGKFRFTIQPVYSMTTSGFETNIAMRSRYANHMLAMSTQMRSVINTILPIGYGFYIIDEKGVILFQSDGKVTLRENFLEWLNDGQKISYGLAARENKYLSQVEINNKPFSLYFKPINNLPWQIVTYHQKEFSESSILHIISFLLFFLAIYFPFVFAFCFLAWQRTQYLSRLNKRIDQYTWLKPGENKQMFLRNANIFLSVYGCFTLLYIVIIPNNTPLLFIAFWFPVFALTVLYMLYRHYVLLEEQFVPLTTICRKHLSDFFKGFNIAPIVTIVILNYLFYNLEEDFWNRMYFVVFQLLSFSILWIISKILKIISGNKRGESLKLKLKSNDLHKTPSQLFWFLSVISLSIIPTCCFFTFAQKNEIDLVVKNRQLALMQKAENRINELKWLVPIAKKHGLNDTLLVKGFFDDGIYHLDSLDAITQKQPGKVIDTAQTNVLYRAIIDKTSWNYRSLDKMLPTSNSSGDGHWNWSTAVVNNHTIGTLFYKLRPDIVGESKIEIPDKLEYHAHVPDLLEYLNMDNPAGLLIIVFSSVMLLFGLFFLLRSVLYRVFLTKYMKDYSEAETGPDNLIKKETKNWNIAVSQKIEMLFAKHKIEPIELKGLRKIWENEFTYDKEKRFRMDQVEENILFNQHYLNDFYTALWDGCDLLEQYCLYNLAKNGFINYKNTRIIRSLYFKGLLLNDKTNNDIRMISLSFSNFVLDKGEQDFKEKLGEIRSIQKGSWNSIRTPIMIVITAVGAFLFITEQGVFEKTAALLPTLSGLLGLAGNLIGSKGDVKG